MSCSSAIGVTVREECSCGAAIRASKRTVLHWRVNHHHPTPADDPGPQKQGSHADTQIAYGDRYVDDGGYRGIPDVQARLIGFTPNA